MLVFACLSPHPPLLLPSVGSEKDREGVRATIEALEKLGERLKTRDPDEIIISSPHPDWGFNVPLHFLAQDFEGEMKKILTGPEPPTFYFEQGKELYQSKAKGQEPKIAFIASGDLSHCLKEEGPYGFHPHGPQFDQTLIQALKEKDTERILNLDNEFPQAGECGLRSFCFLLGILEATGLEWKVDILSYEGPFGVGYLVAEFKL